MYTIKGKKEKEQFLTGTGRNSPAYRNFNPLKVSNAQIRSAVCGQCWTELFNHKSKWQFMNKRSSEKNEIPLQCFHRRWQGQNCQPVRSHVKAGIPGRRELALLSYTPPGPLPAHARGKYFFPLPLRGVLNTVLYSLSTASLGVYIPLKIVLVCKKLI